MKKRLSTYQKWEKKVFERDGYKCQKCGLPKDIDYFSIPPKIRPKLVGHHIIGRTAAPHLIFDVTNGLTLCAFCHHDIHLKRIKDAS